MKKRFLIFIKTLVDEREEFDENIYFSGFSKILYYLLIPLFSFYCFIIFFGIFNGRDFQILNITIPRAMILIVEMLLLFVSLLCYKVFKNKNKLLLIIPFIIFLVLLMYNDNWFWIHWLLLFFISIFIIIYRFLIIDNLNTQIIKLNSENKKNKISLLNKDLNIDLRDKTREIFLKKVKESYNFIENKDNYEKLKENIEKIYNEQKLERVVKRLLLIPIVPFIGKFLYDYFESNRNIFSGILTLDNIQKWSTFSNVSNFILFLIILFMGLHFIYKLFELRFRDKRKRISEVAECIEILYRREENNE